MERFDSAHTVVLIALQGAGGRQDLLTAEAEVHPRSRPLPGSEQAEPGVKPQPSDSAALECRPRELRGCDRQAGSRGGGAGGWGLQPYLSPTPP